MLLQVIRFRSPHLLVRIFLSRPIVEIGKSLRMEEFVQWEVDEFAEGEEMRDSTH